MTDGTAATEAELTTPPKEDSTKTIEDGIAQVNRVFRTANLDEARRMELLPEGKSVSYVEQQSYLWFARFSDPEEPHHDFEPGTVDGEIYSVHFSDGSVSFFTHAKVPARNPWRNLGSELPAYDMAVNNTATWDGKDHMEVVIPVGQPTKDGPVTDRIDVRFDGKSTTFSTTHPDKTVAKQTVVGDLAKPDFMLAQWEDLIKSGWNYPKQTSKLTPIKYGQSPTTVSPQTIVQPQTPIS